MSKRSALAVSMLSVFLGSTPALAAPTSEIVAAVNGGEREKLQSLFAASDEASLQRNPLFALFRGDLRYADTIGDMFSDRYYIAEREAVERNLKALAAIDRNKLNAVDQIAYDVFHFNQHELRKWLKPEMLDLTETRPLNHMFGVHSYYPDIANGKGVAPFATVADYENNIKRHANFAQIVDRAIERFRRGQRIGVLESQLTMRNVIEQLDSQLALPLEKSPYWQPALNFPAEFSDGEKERLKAQLRESLDRDVLPALKRLRDYLRDSYLPQARAGDGLSTMKGGDKVYRELVRSATTLDISPEEIHALGLTEVNRILAQMEQVKSEVGFSGTLQEFFDHLRTDPKFKISSREAMTQAYYDIGKRVEVLLPKWFSVRPKSRLEIRPFEEYREEHEAAAAYEQGTPDGSKPGIFHFNAYDLPSRTTPRMVTLYLHEASPGHHFQVSLTMENEALPSVLRFGPTSFVSLGNSAFIEGWALYAETLGYEMGLFDDPYARFGTLSDEMLRAMRLVVDTGIHTKGWSRERAIDYMLANSDMGRTDATAEVERYIAIPGQAVSYKIGAMAIQRLRKKAETALGTRFDIRAFHDQVLNSGELPLAVLEKKIDRWIVSMKG
jgi:uncharacterized protein (DUF885 family)